MTSITVLKQALDNQDYAQAEVLINADRDLLLQHINGEYIPLEYYCAMSCTATVEWLCQKMTSLNISIDIVDLNDVLIIQNIYVNNLGKMVNILQKYSSAANLRQWLVQRQLVCVLGANFLFENNIALTRQQAEEAEAGFVAESVQVMCSAIDQLMTTNSRYADIQEGIMNYYANTHQQDNKKKLLTSIINQVNQKNNPRVIFNSGHQLHVFSVSIKRQDDGIYQLSFYDANSPDDTESLITTIRSWVTGETAIVRRINVPAQQLTNIVTKLLSLKNLSEKEAYSYINLLHKLFDGSYEYDQGILVDAYNLENNRCYWQNPKYAIMDLFIDKFGIEEGIKDYNKFLTTINLKLLANFKAEFPDQYNEEALNNLEKVIHKNQVVRAPKTYAVRALLSLLGSAAAIAVTVCCGYALVGLPVFATLGAFLGPVGLPVILIGAATLIFHEWTLRGLAKLASAASALVSFKMVPLIQKKDKKEVLLANSLSTPLSAISLNEPVLEEHPITSPITIHTVKNKSSMSLISRLFAKSLAEPLVQSMPVKLQLNDSTANSHKFYYAGNQLKSLTMQEDLDELWDVPMRSVLSRLQG